MAKTTVEVEIVAILREAKKSVADFSASTQKQLDSLNMKASISALADGFRIIEQTAGRAFGAVKDVLSDAIGEAIQGEEAMTKLANSMRLVGDFSKSAEEDMRGFADELQRTTTNSDDAVLSALAIAKNFNLTNKEAREATKAAADFAAATGTDLDSAVARISRTLNGLVDKDLAKYLPALKGISKEQLVLGEGVSLIADRFRGFAAAMGETFNGAVQKARNSMNDLLESIGEIIITNPVLIKSIQIASAAFGDLKGEVDGNKGAISAFITDSVKAVAAFVPSALAAVKVLDQIASSVINLFRAVGTALGGYFAALDALRTGNISGALDVIKEAGKDILDIYDKTQKRLNGFYDPLIKSAQNASDKIQTLGLIPNKKSQIELKVNKSDAQILADRMKGALAEGAEELKKKMQEAFDKQKQAITDIAANPFKGLFPGPKPGDTRAFSDSQEKGIATGAGLLKSVLGGADGARDLVKGLSGAIADSIVPGLGPVISEIVGILSQGKDVVKKQVTEFARAIPEIIQNIAESLPVLIEALARELPPALAKTMPKVAISFSVELIKNIPNIVKGFAEGLIQAAGDFVDAIWDAIKGLVSGGGGNGSSGPLGDIPIVGGIFDGIAGVIGDIGNFFGLADGGSVPDIPRFAGDKFGPVMLDGGEEVLDKSTANRLRSALADGSLGNGGGKQPDIVINIGLQQFARIMFDARRAGYQV